MSSLPVIDTSERLIHGVILKCVDGRWTADTDDYTGRQLLALASTRAAQCWLPNTKPEHRIEQNNEPIDIDALNAKIAPEQWGLDLNGQPRPPWQKVYVIYLLNPTDAGILTFLNSTFGAKLAYERLCDRVEWMRALRGADVFPLVALDAKPMKTKMGVKQRPEFTVVEWRELGATAPRVGAPQQRAIEAKPIGKPVAEPTVHELLDDEIPF